MCCKFVKFGIINIIIIIVIHYINIITIISTSIGINTSSFISTVKRFNIERVIQISQVERISIIIVYGIVHIVSRDGWACMCCC